jgi:hypothetical protein
MGIAKQFPMKRTRPRAKFGSSFSSWLALFALALQLALSFGHVHLHDIGSTGVKVAGTQAPSAPSSPDHPAGDADDYCAICATIHLASTSFLPDAPQLPVPFVSQTVEHFHHVAFISVARQRTPFQSRAPPLA